MQKALPFCSVIIPTRDRPEALADCLAALSQLEYPSDRFEVIIVDDGSAAALSGVVAEARGQVSTTLVRQESSGPSVARNTGARIARGELLVFTDDDCRPDPAWLRRIADEFTLKPECGFGGRTINTLTENAYAAASQLVITVGYAQNNHQPDDAHFFASNNLAFPRHDFLALGGFDPAYRTSEDRDLCARWVLSGRQLVYVSDAVVAHANPLTLRGFWHQNFTYGQGAFRFHRDQARRVGKRVPIEPSFYLALARRACSESGSLRGSLVGLWLLCIWHVANTVGFVDEWWRLRDKRDQGVDVLHVAWSGRVGGIERLVEGYVRAASVRAGPRHLACLLDGRGPIGDALAAEGLALQLGLRGGWDVVGLWRFARLTRRVRPRVMVMYTHALAPCLGALVARPRGIRIYQESSVRVFSKGLKFRLLYLLLRHTTALFLAPTEAVAHALRSRGVDPASIRVVPNGVSVALAVAGSGSANGKPVVGIVGRLEQQKRIDLYLDVLAALRSRNVQLSGIVVGGGSLESQLTTDAETLGLTGVVEFAGEQADVTPWLDRLDVFLMTSEVETFGIAAAEAMARGVPVVAMPSGSGLDDLVRNGGVLLADREIATAADTVERLLASPAQQREAQRRGATIASALDYSLLIGRLDELCDEASGIPTSPPHPAPSPQLEADFRSIS